MPFWSPKKPKLSKEDLTRERLGVFFAKYDPSKIAGIGVMMAKCEGREDPFMEVLSKRFGPEPTGNERDTLIKQRRELLTERLQNYYQHYAKQKLAVVESEANKFLWQEAAFFQQLEAEYGKEADVPGYTAPDQSTSTLQPSVSNLGLSASMDFTRPPPGSLEEVLVAVYSAVDPNKVPEVATLAKKYAGKESALFSALSTKYGAKVEEIRQEVAKKNGAGGDTGAQEALEAKLRAYFGVVDPSKAASAKPMAAKYKSNPDAICRALSAKYGKEVDVVVAEAGGTTAADAAGGKSPAASPAPAATSSPVPAASPSKEPPAKTPAAAAGAAPPPSQAGPAAKAPVRGPHHKAAVQYVQRMRSATMRVRGNSSKMKNPVKRVRLLNFFRRHNPERMYEVDELLDDPVNEKSIEPLMKKLVAEYGPEPPPYMPNDEDKAQLREILHDFYVEVDPQMATPEELDARVKKYVGMELDLFNALEDKYGARPRDFVYHGYTVRSESGELAMDRTPSKRTLRTASEASVVSAEASPGEKTPSIKTTEAEPPAEVTKTTEPSQEQGATPPPSLSKTSSVSFGPVVTEEAPPIAATPSDTDDNEGEEPRPPVKDQSDEATPDPPQRTATSEYSPTLSPPNVATPSPPPKFSEMDAPQYEQPTPPPPAPLEQPTTAVHTPPQAAPNATTLQPTPAAMLPPTGVQHNSKASAQDISSLLRELELRLCVRPTNFAVPPGATLEIAKSAIVINGQAFQGPQLGSTVRILGADGASQRSPHGYCPRCGIARLAPSGTLRFCHQCAYDFAAVVPTSGANTPRQKERTPVPSRRSSLQQHGHGGEPQDGGAMQPSSSSGDGLQVDSLRRELAATQRMVDDLDVQLLDNDATRLHTAKEHRREVEELRGTVAKHVDEISELRAELARAQEQVAVERRRASEWEATANEEVERVRRLQSRDAEESKRRHQEEVLGVRLALRQVMKTLDATVGQHAVREP